MISTSAGAEPGRTRTDGGRPTATVRTLQLLLLSGGFLAVAAGLLVAIGSPTTGFERSIYASTPMATWVLLVAALLLAFVGALFWRTTYHRYAAVVLGSAAMTAVVVLPLARGYRYLGNADPLTHLGWARDILTGAMQPSSLLYPGIHSLAVVLTTLTGEPLDRALLEVVVVCFIAFLVFVPLTVRAITDDVDATVAAAVSAWLVLPMNQIATVLMPHTNSLTLLLVPLVLFVVVLYLTRSGRPLVGPYGSSLGVVLVVLSAGLILYHPQHALNVLLVLGAISVVQFAVRRRYPAHPIAAHRPLYLQTGLLLVMFVGWTSVHPQIGHEFDVTLIGLLNGFGAAGVVAQRGTSLADIGVSLADVFLKLFAIAAVYGLLAAAFTLAVLTDRIETDTQVGSFTAYFAVAFVPLAGLFAVYFFGTPKMSFRQLGFVYVLVTMVGAIALAKVRRVSRSRSAGPGGRGLSAALSLVIAVGLVLSVMTVFPSPFIYSATPQVTDQGMSGYAVAFQYRVDHVPYATLGSDPNRYGDAILGTTAGSAIDPSGRGDGIVDPAAVDNGSLAAGYSSGEYYLALTPFDVQQQVDVYHQLHYTRQAVDRVGSRPGANLVESNGGFELFVVR